MTELQRRTVLVGAAGAAALLPSGAAAWPGKGAVAGAPLIDGHCHLFNAKDLSAVRFLRYVVAGRFPALAPPPEQFGFEPDDPDRLDRIIGRCLKLLGADDAPDADMEIAQLEGRAAVPPMPESAAEEAAVRDRLALFLRTGRAGPGPVDQKDAAADRALRRYVLDAAREPAALDQTMSEGAALKAAVKALRDFDLAQTFYWFRLFRHPRHRLVDQLAALHRRSKHEPLLLAPAMVDFGRWLGHDPDVTLEDQVRVMGRVAARREGPAVHGYVAFDPLRQVLFERKLWGRSPERTEPLLLVRQALEDHGFLGVKLYPPMGFSAADNQGLSWARPGFPVDVLELAYPGRSQQEQNSSARQRELGRDIDLALEKLYRLCEDLQAPIMAHMGEGTQANVCYSRFADPLRWRPVFERPANRLRILIAHVGAFRERSGEPVAADCKLAEGQELPYETTFEAYLGRWFDAHKERPVYADISMFHEPFTLSGFRGDERRRRRAIREGFAKFLPSGSPRWNHVVYGTDWSMLAIKRGHGAYTAKALAFLRGATGMTDREALNLLRRNFVRYAGLDREGPARERLGRFYARNGLPMDRLDRLLA